MPGDNIAWEATFIPDNLVIRIVNDKTLCARDGTVVESISYSSTTTNWTFRIMAIRDVYTEMASIAQGINYGLGMMKYKRHKIAETRLFIHANCPLSHCFAIR